MPSLSCVSRAALLSTSLFLLTACDLQHSDEDEVSEQIAALRALTEPFRSFAAAQAAGWSTQITPCMDNPPTGGMGFHYGKTDFIDADAEVLEPELLVYEPQPGGQLALVAVEYIVPFSERSAEEEAPVLFERAFHHNHEFQVWALHVWIWKDNPDGMFADWNPEVSCAHAGDAP